MNNSITRTNEYSNLVTIYGATYSNAIKKFLTEYDRLTYDNIVDFLNNAKNKYSSSTVSLYKAALKKYIKSNMHDLTKRAVIDTAFNDIKISKQSKIISEEKIISRKTVKSMIEKSNKRDGLIIETLYTTGFRVSELINIKLDKCKKVNGNSYEYINILVVGKGSKERYIYISIELFSNITKTFNGIVYLFETGNNTQYLRMFIHKIVNRAGSRVLGTKQVHPHTLRHSFATHLLKNENKSIKAVSSYLGHSSTAITNDYYIHDSLNINDVFLLSRSLKE